MMKYFRLKKGKIIDLDKIIEQEKRNEYYTDYKFDDLKNTKDGCKLEYSCISNLIEPKGKLCNFAMICDSPFIAQANTIEELCDEFVLVNPGNDYHETYVDLDDVFDRVEDLELNIGIKSYDEARNLIYSNEHWNIYSAIWTDKGLIYVAKMNDKGCLELL